MRLELTHRFAIPLQDGFDYIVEPRNWPDYWPGLRRVQPGSRWRAPGDRACVAMRLLGHSVELEMTLRRFEPYRLVEYTSVQRGLPDARHERGFAAVAEGFEYLLAVEYEPREGLRGAFDRAVVRRAIERTMRRTVANLERSLSGAGFSAGAGPRAARPRRRSRPRRRRSPAP